MLEVLQYISLNITIIVILFKQYVWSLLANIPNGKLFFKGRYFKILFLILHAAHIKTGQRIVNFSGLP